MRDYGIVSPKFWIGTTGRQLRKMPYAQRVAMYLMTAPAADMSGVFYCPMATILNDVGAPCAPLEAPSKPLQRGVFCVKEALEALSDLDFCFYDFESEFVFVKEMARYQIADKLKPTDNRVKSLRKTVDDMPEPIKTRFLQRYNQDFSLGFEIKKQLENDAEIESPFGAPSEALRSQEQEQEQEQEIKVGGAFSEKVADAPEPSFPDFPEEVSSGDDRLLDGLEPISLPSPETKPVKKEKRGTRLDVQTLPDEWGAFVKERAPDLDPDLVFEEFKNYWVSQPGQKGVKLDWFATFRNNVISMPDGKRRALSRKHTSFEHVNYHEGINPDGSF